MDGPGLLKLAARKLPVFLARVLAEAALGLDDIDVVIPHQVSEVGLRYLSERLKVPASKMIDILATCGNQVSASLPSALDAAVSSGMLRRARGLAAGHCGRLVGRRGRDQVLRRDDYRACHSGGGFVP